MKNILHRKIKKIIQEEVLIKKAKESTYFLTGKNGKWIFDFRRVFLQGEYLEVFSQYFWDKYEEHFPFQIGGLEFGSVPLIGGILIEGMKRGHNINAFIVRKDRKKTGTGNALEGYMNDSKVIIIDDIYNSGKSVSKVIDQVLLEKKSILEIFVFVKFGNPFGDAYLTKMGVNLVHEYTPRDFGLGRYCSYGDITSTHQYPIISPNYSLLCKGENANRFLQFNKSTPCKKGRYIYMAGESGKFMCFDIEQKSVQWEFYVNPVAGHKNILSSPVLVDDKVLFGAYDGNFYCLNAENGEIIWKYTDADWIGSSPEYSEKNRCVYVGLEFGGAQNKGGIVALNLDTGVVAWLQINDDYVHCSPLYIQEVDYVIWSSNEGMFSIANGSTGKIVFSEIIGGVNKASFCYDYKKNKLFFGTLDKKLYCFNIGKSSFEWKRTFPDDIYVTPLIIGTDLLFGCADKFFYHVDGDGNILAKEETLGKIFSSAISVSSSSIIFGSNDAHIYIYNTLLKQVQFIIAHPERIMNQMIYDADFGTLYVEDAMNNLYEYYIGPYLNTTQHA